MADGYIAKYKTLSRAVRFVPAGGAGLLSGSFPLSMLTNGGNLPSQAEIRILYRPNTGDIGDGVVVATTTCNTDGTWQVANLNESLKYDIVARIPGFNDVIISDVQPAGAPLTAYFAGIKEEYEYEEKVSIQVVALGGKPPYVFEAVSLPEGLSINSLGVITGNMLGKLNVTFDVIVTDSEDSVVTLSANSYVDGDSHWDKVVALLPLDGDFEDKTGWLWTKQGTAATIIEDGKFGKALRFTGAAGNALQAMPGNEGHRLSFDKDWTVEFWVRMSEESTGPRVPISRGRNGSTLSYWMQLNLNRVGWVNSRYGSGGTTESFNVSYEFTPNVWYHIAIVGEGRNLSAFVNGVRVGGKTFTMEWYNPPVTSADGLRIGSLDYEPYSYWFVGDLCDVRVTNGVARYTENFDPPTSPFPIFKDVVK